MDKLHVSREFNLRVPLELTQKPERPAENRQEWTKGTCPNCGYANADVDSEGILWCPACGYSKKGCYT
jgi:ribosomal protein L37AE/L43A